MHPTALAHTRRHDDKDAQCCTAVMQHSVDFDSPSSTRPCQRAKQTRCHSSSSHQQSSSLVAHESLLTDADNKQAHESVVVETYAEA